MVFLQTGGAGRVTARTSVQRLVTEIDSSPLMRAEILPSILERARTMSKLTVPAPKGVDASGTTGAMSSGAPARLSSHD